VSAGSVNGIRRTGECSCFLTRSEILAETSANHSNPHDGLSGNVEMFGIDVLVQKARGKELDVVIGR